MPAPIDAVNGGGGGEGDDDGPGLDDLPVPPPPPPSNRAFSRSCALVPEDDVLGANGGKEL